MDITKHCSSTPVVKAVTLTIHFCCAPAQATMIQIDFNGTVYNIQYYAGVNIGDISI